MCVCVCVRAHYAKTKDGDAELASHVDACFSQISTAFICNSSLVLHYVYKHIRMTLQQIAATNFRLIM